MYAQIVRVVTAAVLGVLLSTQAIAADSKISDLTSGSAPQNADAFVIARSGANFKLTWAQMVAGLGTMATQAASSVAITGGTIADVSLSGALSGVPRILDQSFAGAAGAADTNENALATITVPANALGVNGALRIWTWWGLTNSVNAKTLRVRFSGASGTAFLSVAPTTNATYIAVTTIGNRGATNSQIGGMTPGAVGGTSTTLATSAVDTSVQTTIVITGQKASAGETLRLEGYIVELLRP